MMLRRGRERKPLGPEILAEEEEEVQDEAMLSSFRVQRMKMKTWVAEDRTAAVVPRKEL